MPEPTVLNRSKPGRHSFIPALAPDQHRRPVVIILESSLARYGQSSKLYTMRFLLLLFVAFLFAGCVTSASKISQISLGMTKAHVVEILGQPKSVSARADGTELLRYELSGRNAPILNPYGKNFSDGYTVQLNAGEVVAYGRDDEFRAIQIRTN